MKAIVAALLAGLCLLGVTPLQAAEVKAGAIVVTDAWTRATPPGSDVAAGYVTISNTGDAPDRMTGASADFATVQVHQMSLVNGVMKMGELTEGLEIPGHGTVKLALGSSHLMFVGLKHPLVKGQSVRATLSFEHAGPVSVDFPVAAIGATAP